MNRTTASNASNALIVLPTWVGDVAMATPTLRALRARWTAARITYLVRSYVKPLIDAAPWHDRLIVTRPGRDGVLSVGARLRRRGFDTIVLLPNSFRSALVARLAGAPRRIGYARDGRGWLLSDRLEPPRENGRFVPTPIIDYYLKIAVRLGADVGDRRMQLFTRPRHDERARRMLEGAGVALGERPLVMLNPGAANHGDAKLWPADRFAAVADRLIESHGATILVNGSPKERPILDAVQRAAMNTLIDLPSLGSDLRLLKSFVKLANVMITNDTGPRHIAAAFATPVVSLFGPTDPQWTQIDFPHERIVQAPGTPGRMIDIEVDTVVRHAQQLLDDAAKTGSPIESADVKTK